MCFYNYVNYKSITHDKSTFNDIVMQKARVYNKTYCSNYMRFISDSESAESPVDLGTQCGGQIEVYTTVEDATAQDEYLSAFDGGALSNGSHYVLRSMVIRTFDLLKASQQKELNEAITEALKNG